MTEYTVKEIGHQWIVYADRLSVGACADEDSALKLIVEHSAANSATRKSTVQGIPAHKQLTDPRQFDILRCDPRR
jgi:hypothetical protein